MTRGTALNPFCQARPAIRACTARDNRRVVEAVLWVMRTGRPWRDLSSELGHWHRTYVRFSRWREKGHLGTCGDDNAR